MRMIDFGFCRFLRQWYCRDRRLPERQRSTRRFCRPGVESLETRTLPAIFWNGPGGGDWSDPDNWSGGAVPAATDDVVINPAGITVIHSTGTDFIHSLTSQADLSISGGSLSIAASSSCSGSFTLSGGTL